MRKLLIILALCLPCSAQLWTGILNSNTGTDWTRAGANNTHGGSFTQCTAGACATANSAGTSATATQLNAALSAACTTGNQYVLLASGTYNITGITITGSNCELRGAGSNSTFLVFSGATSSCNGLVSYICVQGPNVSAGGNPSGTNITAGLTQGSTSLTLASAAGITNNVTMLMIDGCDTGATGVPCAGTVTDNGNAFACATPWVSPNGCAGESTASPGRTLRSQIQITYATNVVGNVVTIADPIVAPNWGSVSSPQVWLYASLVNVGIDNLSIDLTGTSKDAIKLYGCLNCWVTDNRIINADKYFIQVFESSHVDVQRNYMAHASNVDPYCLSPNYSGFNRYESNIIQQCHSPFVAAGPDVGSVLAYNYFVNTGGGGFMSFSTWHHAASSYGNLFEGNIGNGVVLDNIHGAHFFNTFYRNYYQGWEPGSTGQTNAMYCAAFSRYCNIVGNVFGSSGHTTTYKSMAAASAPAATAIIVGPGNEGVPADTVASGSALLWGNYDTVTAAVRWCGNSSDTGWSTTCSSTSEVPTAAPVYPTSVPTKGDTGAGMSAMPASFYLPAKPSWWNTEPYPPIGPDVSSGTVYGTTGSTSWIAQSGLGGHANNNPALDCFMNVMGGAADGTGSVLAYTSSSCFSGTTTPTASTPTCTPASGIYTTTQTVSCSDTSAGAIMCYTTYLSGQASVNPVTDGASGCTAGTLYTSSLSVAVSQGLNIVAGGTGYLDSAVQGYNYTINSGPGPGNPVGTPGRSAIDILLSN